MTTPSERLCKITKIVGFGIGVLLPVELCTSAAAVPLLLEVNI
jgi:hypothetical protein